MAARLLTASSPEAKTLARAGVNLQSVLRGNYARFANGQEIADRTYCVESAPFITHELNKQLGIGRTSLRALAELHLEDTTDEDPLYHAYTLVNQLGAGPNTDIVVDATYRQFIPKRLRDNYPLVFIGSRAAAADMIQHVAQNPTTHTLYQPETIYGTDRHELTQEFAIPVRLQDMQ